MEEHSLDSQIYKPHLPTGMEVPGFPAIQSFVFATQLVEIYSLGQKPREKLLLVRDQSEESQGRANQLEWWAHLATQGLTIVEQDLQIGRDASHCSVLKINGHWLEKDLTIACTQALSFGLLSAFVALGHSMQTLGLSPVCEISLLWRSDESENAPIFSVLSTEAIEDERSQIYSLVATFYSLLTGIDLSNYPKDRQPPSIQSWSNGINPHIAKLVDNCFAGRCPTFASLEQELNEVLASSFFKKESERLKFVPVSRFIVKKVRSR